MTTKKQTEKKAQKPAATKKVDVKRIQTDVKAGLSDSVDDEGGGGGDEFFGGGGSGWRTW